MERYIKRQLGKEISIMEIGLTLMSLNKKYGNYDVENIIKDFKKMHKLKCKNENVWNVIEVMKEYKYSPFEISTHTYLGCKDFTIKKKAGL